VNKASVFLWYKSGAEAAARFYADTFPGQCTVVSSNPMATEFILFGIPCTGLNGGPDYSQSPAFSFQVTTETQDETDKYWQALTDDGGESGRCGWCKDRWGISWQIIPRALSQGLSDPDFDVRERVQAAMMRMDKIDVAAIDAARKG
jgi:predicted 3-demethylubiquinone-9 3-methyltransferase (glyoxalase superfamily)